mmetsp:Transcript_42478/g.83742  ORF Transcript_42478/g.83742 Transcript_42478/m.83742 type:complete len:158 (-) Transcript_42478:163-636(-)
MRSFASSRRPGSPSTSTVVKGRWRRRSNCFARLQYLHPTREKITSVSAILCAPEVLNSKGAVPDSPRSAPDTSDAKTAEALRRDGSLNLREGGDVSVRTRRPCDRPEDDADSFARGLPQPVPPDNEETKENGAGGSLRFRWEITAQTPPTRKKGQRK